MNSEIDRRLYSQNGLSQIESWGRWSDGSHVRFNFNIDLSGCDDPSAALVFTIHPYLYKGVDKQKLYIAYQDSKIEMVINGQKSVRLPVAKEQLNVPDSTGTNFTVDMHIPDAFPSDAREDGPARSVGIGFSSISVH